jgi:hypothetical protein
MDSFRVVGDVDNNHRRVAAVPTSIPPGKVSILVLGPAEEDEAGSAWSAGVAREWHEELCDSREDIYTLSEGAPVDGPR